jgi:hypothetical protein
MNYLVYQYILHMELCVSSTKAVSAIYRKEGEVSHTVSQNPQVNSINQGRKKMDPVKARM